VSYKNHQELFNDIKARKFKPVYLLHGEEPYYIDLIADHFENHILTEDQKDFNLTICYGKDTTSKTIYDACMRFPMFAELNVVILREAQMMQSLRQSKGEEEDKEVDTEVDLLQKYLERPSPATILVLCYKHGKFDARKKTFRHIKEKGAIFESQRPKDSDLPAFVEQQLKKHKVKIEPQAMRLFIEYVGAELSTLMNELEKLCINLPEGGTINVEQIENGIGISKEYNVFELQSALLTKDHVKAFTIVQYINDNQKANPFVLTITNLHSAFHKLYHYLIGGEVSDNEMYTIYQIHFSQKNEYRKAKTLYSLDQVEDIFELLLEYDLRSKGVHNNNNSTPNESLLQELVYRIMH